MKTYAITWREPDGRTFVGRLALGPLTLGLDGRRRGVEEPPVNRQFDYEALSDLRIGSQGTERLDGRPALVVEQPEGAYLVGDAGMGAPILQELVERLTERRSRGRKNVAANPQAICDRTRIAATPTGSTLGPQAKERKGGTT